MSEEINHDRRRFLGTILGTILGTTAMTVGAAQFGMMGSVKAQFSKLPTEGELPSLGRATEWLNSHP